SKVFSISTQYAATKCILSLFFGEFLQVGPQRQKFRWRGEHFIGAFDGNLLLQKATRRSSPPGATAVLLRPSPLPIAAGRLRQIPNGMSAPRVRLRKPDGAQDSVWPGRTVRVRLVREGRLRLETRSAQHKFR